MELLNANWGVLFSWTLNNGYNYFWVARDYELFHVYVVPMMDKYAKGILNPRLARGEKDAVLYHLNDRTLNLVDFNL